MSPRDVATPRTVALAAAFVLLLAACSEPIRYVNLDQPPAEPGFYAFAFERIATPRINAVDGVAADEEEVWSASVWGDALTSEDIRIEATGRRGVLRVGSTLYVNAEFRVHNDGADPIERLALLGYRHEAFRVSSAVSQPLLAATTPAPDADVRRIAPTNRMTFDSAFLDTGEALVGAPFESHFIALEEAEVPDVSGFEGFLEVLPYGFSVAGGATIAPGDSATVQLAFAVPRRPRGAGDLTNFVWNAVLVAAPDVRVAQAPAEKHARGWEATLERAARADATRVFAIGAGERQVPADVDCASLVGLADVRIAGEGPADEAYVGLIETAHVEAPVFVGCEGASP